MSQPTDTKALAAIRPGDPKAKLAAAIGERWMEPQPALAGKIRHLERDFSFTVRLDRDGNVGQVSYDHKFDPGAPIEGVRMGMSEGEVKRVLPQMKFTDPSSISPYCHGMLRLPNGAALTVQVSHDNVTRILVMNHEAVYPGRGPMPLPPPRSTFDVSIVPGLRPRATAAPDGWCCGLPRGITPIQWPLSCSSGFPLEHYFTVRVPESYRVKGQPYVALAFFGEGEQFKPSPPISNLMGIVFDGRNLPGSVEPDLQPFLHHLLNRHPMEFRSMNILEDTFTAIWLTEEEFTGSECEPPEPIINNANSMCIKQEWQTVTTAQRLFGWDGKDEFDPDRSYLHRLAGRPLSDKWDLLLLRMTEHTDDPNTGRQPVDLFFDTDPNPDGYIPKWSDEWNALNVAWPYSHLHFGGTVSPQQALPDLTPFFIEFEETMGMINFGGGNGQLDLVMMQIDWACG